jgi:hypothetical protein
MIALFKNKPLDFHRAPMELQQSSYFYCVIVEKVAGTSFK